MKTFHKDRHNSEDSILHDCIGLTNVHLLYISNKIVFTLHFELRKVK
jgi:hypothetical protein